QQRATAARGAARRRAARRLDRGTADSMRLDVAIQMDPIESINVLADSTFVLALEAQARGHRLYHYLPRQLSLIDGRVTAQAQRLRVWRDRKKHAALGPVETLDLKKMDVILMRQDQPFDM